MFLYAWGWPGRGVEACSVAAGRKWKRMLTQYSVYVVLLYSRTLLCRPTLNVPLWKDTQQDAYHKHYLILSGNRRLQVPWYYWADRQILTWDGGVTVLSGLMKKCSAPPIIFLSGVDECCNIEHVWIWSIVVIESCLFHLFANFLSVTKFCQPCTICDTLLTPTVNGVGSNFII